MELHYCRKTEDIKFLCYCLFAQKDLVKRCKTEGKTLVFKYSEETRLIYENRETTGVNDIFKRLFEIAGEEYKEERIEKEIEKIRKTPTQMKCDFLSLKSLINYINLVRKMIEEGSLKYKDYLEKYEADFAIPFDSDFYLFELRAGKINSVCEIEGMDKLYREDVESDKHYQICSGLRGYYKKEELQGNTYLFMLNIKDIKLGNVISEGMICCGKEGDVVEAIRLVSSAGEKIYFGSESYDQEVTGGKTQFIPMFRSVSYGKIDLKKSKYKKTLEKYCVVDGFLTFKGIKAFCAGKEIKLLKVHKGPMS